MRSIELVLNFSSNTAVNVSFDDSDSGQIKFVNPITDKDKWDIRWYVEIYGAKSLANPDDLEALRIKNRLPEIGKSLFNAVFDNRETQRLFDRFQDVDERRVLTIASHDASILALPWELLFDPFGIFLFREKPHISVRRKISGSTGGRKAFHIETKDRLHLLFVVSRPTGVGFIDPRSDSQAVLDALEKHASGRVTWEFLLPATLNALVERLDDDTKRPVDILHFDGHGIFRKVSEEDTKKEPGRFGKSILSEIQRTRNLRGEHTTGKPVGIGFLVFEKEDRTKHLISAEDLADNLFRSKVALVVLSACQTATLDIEGDPMASVAGRLTSTGIPSILAMTHAVLVITTKMLFGRFYESLARGRGIATALDDARTYLANNPEKYEVWRGAKRQMLKLDDWFLPALFHGGSDTALLTSDDDFQPPQKATIKKCNFRQSHEAGFFGRSRELWNISYWFRTDETRRISITGFGGQGKTELALEAGRWLVRTGMFKHAVFVDYSQVQGEDACSMAFNTISTVLDQSLVDSDAATEALRKTPTLVILDNLETISTAALSELLSAAVAWSCAGKSRVLLTCRTPEFGHPDYRIKGTLKHRRIELKGLGSAANPDDALDWFCALNKLPPAPGVPPPDREELIQLFDRVGFHPLSIALLTQQLKTRTVKQLGDRLEMILSDEAILSIADDGTPSSLIASLELSMEQLSGAARHAVRRLGVFQGGAFEQNLLAITNLGKNDERKQLEARITALDSGNPRALLLMMGKVIPDDEEIPAELLKQLPATPQLVKYAKQLRALLSNLPKPVEENQWPTLRRQLIAAALIKSESIPGVHGSFLRFHPTLAPMLWAGLMTDERDALNLAHRQRYHSLVEDLYQEDFKFPHMVRAVARYELPNLLYGVHCALDADDPDAVQFSVFINKFLDCFGMTSEAALLTRRAKQAGGKRGSRTWYLAQTSHGQQLITFDCADKAAEVFIDILETLVDQPSFERAATITSLGHCYQQRGRLDLAETNYLEGIVMMEQLEQNDQVKRHRSMLQTDLGNVLRAQGKYPEARIKYKLGQELAIELNDLSNQGITLAELATLAMLEGNISDALPPLHEALELFQRLGDPKREAAAHHMLALGFEKTRQIDQAEHHYRESARLMAQYGDLTSAAKTWNNLATVNRLAGKPEAAETWYCKAIEGYRSVGDTQHLSNSLSNLASLLLSQKRLDEARDLAEESLVIKKNLDPSAAHIWLTHNTLAQIADQQSQPDRATKYRSLAREAIGNFSGKAHVTSKYSRIILDTYESVQQPGKADSFSANLLHLEERGWGNLVGAIRKILSGERKEESLCKDLDSDEFLVVVTILQALENPSSLQALLTEDNESK